MQYKNSRAPKIVAADTASVEEIQASRMVSLGQQGAWTRWESTLQSKITWSDFWKYDFHVRFLLQALYDTLPSPANLLTWKKNRGPSNISLSAVANFLGDE